LTSKTPRETPRSDNPLRATEAARRLGISTKDLLRLIHERKIRYVMVDGIAHVPTDALDEYRAKAS
jgi:excisionase family DNA binding protein